MDKLDAYLIVGHQPWAKGARNPATGLQEYDIHKDVVGVVAENLQKNGLNVQWDEYERGGGNVARWRDIDTRLMVEFHANAFNTQASGCTALYASGSEIGRRAATAFSHRFAKDAGLPIRHNGALPRTRRDRGGYFLWGVRPPAILTEGFFIDNDDDLNKVIHRLPTLYTAALLNCIRNIPK